jgi:hypothetical protein
MICIRDLGNEREERRKKKEEKGGRGKERDGEETKWGGANERKEGRKEGRKEDRKKERK